MPLQESLQTIRCVFAGGTSELPFSKSILNHFLVLRSHCCCSVSPRFMPDWQAVKTLPQMFPVGEMQVHQASEAGVVGGFLDVDHFVDDEIFQALGRFLGEVSVEPDCAGGVVATAPLCFHAADE